MMYWLRVDIAALLVLLLSGVACSQDLVLENASLRERIRELENRVAFLQKRVRGFESEAEMRPHGSGVMSSRIHTGGIESGGYYVPPKAENITPIENHVLFVADRASGVKLPGVSGWHRASTALSVGYTHRRNGWHLGGSLVREDNSRYLEMTSDDYRFSVFGGVENSQGWYLNSMVAAGISTNQKSSHILSFINRPLDRYDGKDTIQVGASIEAGKRLEPFPGFTVTPFGGADFGIARTEGEGYITDPEHNLWDVKALDYKMKDYSIRLIAGVKIRKEFLCGSWSLTPYGGAAIMQPFDGDGGFGFAVYDGERWKTLGARRGAEVQLGLGVGYKNRFRLSLDGTYTDWKDYDEISLSSKLSMDF